MSKRIARARERTRRLFPNTDPDSHIGNAAYAGALEREVEDAEAEIERLRGIIERRGTTEQLAQLDQRKDSQCR